jgi:flagellar motor switch protein FliN/FliY
MPDEKDLKESPDATPAEPQASEPQPTDDGEQSESPDIPADVDPEEALKEVDDSAEAIEESPSAEAEAKDEEDPEAAMMAMLEDLPDEQSKTSPEDIDFGSSQVSKAEFQQLQEPAGEQDEKNIDLLMDVDLPVSIELGRTKMPIADILSLGPGSVVELNKLAGEPVDLMVNNKMVARGEVVVVDENFGLRITQLMTPEERLKSLGKD